MLSENFPEKLLPPGPPQPWSVHRANKLLGSQGRTSHKILADNSVLYCHHCSGSVLLHLNKLFCDGFIISPIYGFQSQKLYLQMRLVLIMPTVTDKQAKTTAAGIVINYVRMGRKYGAFRKRP